MICKLCGTTYTGLVCPFCGLKHDSDPVVWRLNFGKHKGKTIEKVFSQEPTYLVWMVNHNAGTPGQLAKARLLLNGKTNSIARFGSGDDLPVLPVSQLTLSSSSIEGYPNKQLGTSTTSSVPTKGRLATSNSRANYGPKKTASSLTSSTTFWVVLGVIALVIFVAVSNRNSASNSYYVPTAVSRPAAASTSWSSLSSSSLSSSTDRIRELSKAGELTYSAPACNIKGNISFDSHEKIYHMPGQRYYNATSIDPRYGERWFCTEEDAINNGWRKSSQ